jgi:nucleoside-diphosphate-sugar epimerase
MINITEKNKMGIIGSNGFVGSHLTEILNPTNKFENINVLDLKENIFDGIDVLVYLVKGNRGVIVNGLENTLQKALRSGVKKIIYLSTIAVFGNIIDEGINDGSPLLKNQIQEYQSSKVEAEEIVNKFRKKGLNIIILRPGYVYGENGIEHTINFFRLLEDGFYPPENGRGILNAIYVKNLCHIIKLAIDSNIKNEDFNAVDGFEITCKDLFDGYKKILNKKLKKRRKFIIVRNNLISKIVSRIKKFIFPERILISYIDYFWYLCRYQIPAHKLENLLKYKPIYSFDEAMNNINHWYKNIYLNRNV